MKGKQGATDDMRFSLIPEMMKVYAILGNR